jgi:hypothetical protein
MDMYRTTVMPTRLKAEEANVTRTISSNGQQMNHCPKKRLAFSFKKNSVY